MKDSDMHGRGEVTMKKAFSISSNVGIARLAHKNYNDNWEGRLRFRNALSRLGLDSSLGVEIEGEGKPNIKHPQKDKKRWIKTRKRIVK